jgi:hypothetical protein
VVEGELKGLEEVVALVAHTQVMVVVMEVLAVLVITGTLALFQQVAVQVALVVIQVMVVMVVMGIILQVVALLAHLVLVVAVEVAVAEIIMVLQDTTEAVVAVVALGF